jgi:hypothetical protein
LLHISASLDDLKLRFEIKASGDEYLDGNSVTAWLRALVLCLTTLVSRAAL